jgi:hypothetical protein
MGSFWDWLFGKGRPRPSAPEAANDSQDDLLSELREQISGDVAAGFDDAERIVDRAVTTYEGEADPSFLDEHARRILQEELAAHAVEQESWPAETDCDRLDAAFAALERAGIVARQHFTCCGTCGLAEIDREIEAAEAGGGRTRGYTFYHWQDTEAAVNGHGICLYYGSCDAGEAADLSIGREIEAELKRQGLAPKWNGSLDRRIEVPLDWKRRRVGEVTVLA